MTYVFSSFLPLTCLPPPPPQWLLLLMAKPFELHLRYLGYRKYRSGKMYFMTFWWPWPKVMAVTLINKNLLVCRIKGEPLNQSLQNMVAIFLWWCLSPDYILEEFCWNFFFFSKFSSKILDVFRIGWKLGELCDLDLWPDPWPCSFKVKVWNRLIWGMGGWLTWKERDMSRSFMTMTVTYG